MLTSAVSFGLP